MRRSVIFNAIKSRENDMSILKRRIMYLGIMPFIFFINIMVNIAWFNTTIILLLVIIGVMLLRLSDKGEHLIALNYWVKRKFMSLFPDIFTTGIMPNERTLLVVIPCLISIVLNILISIYMR